MARNIPAIGSVYRTLSPHDPWQRIGCGIIDKRAHNSDLQHYNPPTYSIIWVLDGTGTYRGQDEIAYPFGAGDCFHRWPGQVHSSEPGPQGGWVEWFLEIGPALHQGCCQSLLIQPEPCVWRAPLLSLADCERLRHDLDQAHANQLPALATRILSLMVACRAQANSPDHQTTMLDQAAAMLAEQALSREELTTWCQQHGLVYETFRKLFTKRFGLPPGRYRIYRRMEQASALLISSDQSITDIADQLGYVSPYELSAQFRRHFGISPQQFRRQHL